MRADGVGDVRELESGADVAGGVHAPVAGSEPVVDDDSMGSGVNSRARQVEPLDVRRAPGSDQQAIPGELLLRAIRRPAEMHDRCAVRVGHAGDDRAQLELHAIAGQGTLHEDGGIRVVVRQHSAGLIEHRDPAAEPRERLRQLAPDRSAANDQQPIGTFGEVEHRFVREIRGVGETINRRHRRTAAGRNGRPREAQCLGADRDFARAGERGVPEKHLDAQARRVAGPSR